MEPTVAADNVRIIQKLRNFMDLMYLMLKTTLKLPIWTTIDIHILIIISFP